jgi:hypothetical protein
MGRRLPPIALLAALACALGLPASASADAGAAIVNQCFQTGAVSDTYSQAAYREALNELGADAVEYSDCAQLIRAAQLEAAARAGGGGAAATGLAGAPTVPAASFTPKERAQLAALASPKVGGAPVPVGGRLVQPGLVHVNIASAVSALPTPLQALLAILAAAALLALGRLVRDRVGDRGSR